MSLLSILKRTHEEGDRSGRLGATRRGALAAAATGLAGLSTLWAARAVTTPPAAPRIVKRGGWILSSDD